MNRRVHDLRVALDAFDRLVARFVETEKTLERIAEEQIKIYVHLGEVDSMARKALERDGAA